MIKNIKISFRVGAENLNDTRIKLDELGITKIHEKHREGVITFHIETEPKTIVRLMDYIRE